MGTSPLFVVVEHLAVGTFLWVLFLLTPPVIRDGASLWQLLKVGSAWSPLST